MIASDLETGITRLRELVESSRVIVPFTGAGISTECGIPDFRSPGGIWTKNQPILFDDFLASQDMRNEAWRRRFAMEEHFGGAKPGRGHRALASLYRAGKSPGVVTQNIDNLHQASWIAPSAMNFPGSSRGLPRQVDVLRIAPRAMATSNRRPFRLDNRCPRPRWRAPVNSRLRAIFLSWLVHRLSCGRRQDFP